MSIDGTKQSAYYRTIERSIESAIVGADESSFDASIVCPVGTTDNATVE